MPNLTTTQNHIFAIVTRLPETAFLPWLDWAVEKAAPAARVVSVDDGALNNEMLMSVTVAGVTEPELLALTETLEALIPCGAYDHDAWLERAA